jgi:hypothetical protein
MKEKMSLVPKVSIRRDPRFDLERNWEIVEENIRECQERGVLVTPLTVFDNGVLVGWYLHGWVSPPSKILYDQYHRPEQIYVPDYSI